ncbi:unnamed protein product [Phytophthora fragariaefolia]|uniref:Unnamed protein product n=1 Tax=Phytophthora fragariaefolia TaxID=1490495 RepID=A0A9W6XN36_9STRA|nr:unnamed protein product [Phytophthora fragariaefolia]
MGLFGRKSSGARVAEGGGGALAAASPSTAGERTDAKAKGADKMNLELFGADSDDSDDDATIDRYAKDGDESMNEEEAAEAEKRKVAVLNSKVGLYCAGRGRGEIGLVLTRPTAA